MDSYLLTQWQAVELFSRVVCEFDEKLHLKDFQRNVVLNDQLQKYSHEDLYPEITKKIFGTRVNTYKDIVANHPKSFYELGRKIRQNVSIIISDEEVNAYLQYIDMQEMKADYELHAAWIPSNTQRDWENANLYLYYHHQERDDDDINATKFSGVATAILKLSKFGKAEIIGFKESECYIGQFSAYGKEEKHLLLEMKLKKNKKKDLHMLFYVGTGQVKFALGQFHNIGRAIYSGTALIESTRTSKLKNKKPNFYKS